MSVIAVARSIGLVSGARGEVSGTIDHDVVLAASSGLGSAHSGNDDLLAEAARSRPARSVSRSRASCPTALLQRAATRLDRAASISQ